MIEAPITQVQFPFLQATKPEIRLLELLPGNEGPLVCNSSVVCLDDGPDYEALSYHWGDPALKRTVTMNGVKVLVTANLEVALRHLRNKNTQRTLWVDALCINQDEIAERNRQVYLMSRIYSQARAVLVWLGEEGGDSNFVMQTCRLLGEGQELNSGINLIRMRLGVSRLVYRPLWTRIWVLQEVALSQHDPVLVCGYACLPWSSFRKGLQLVSASGEPDPITGRKFPYPEETIRKLTAPNLFHRIREEQKPAGKVSLFHLLQRTTGLCTANPRDRIYGLHGLLPSSSQEQLQIDYNKSIDLVYQEATVYMLRIENDIEMYRSICLSNKRSTQHPSWVPDFSSQKLSSRSCCLQLAPGIQHRTVSGEIKVPHLTVSDNLRSFLVEGITLDRVDDVLVLSEREDIYLQWLERIEQVAIQASKMNIEGTKRTYNVRSLRDKEPIWRALVANQEGGAEYKPAPLEFKNMYEVLRGRAQVPEDFMPLQDKQERTRAYTSPFRTQLSSILPGRAVFTTSSGFWGIGVPEVGVRDSIAVLFGLSIPMVIRHHSGFQTFVGGAYVSGIMDGELVNDYYLKGVIQSEQFDIR